MTTDTRLWNRKVSLLLVEGDKALDLSDFHIKFRTSQADTESPNNCLVRVFNLSEVTITRLGEYKTIILQAGYEGQFGVIFQGTVKQYKIGRENATDNYIDILAADGDIGYNFSVVNKTLERGATPQDQIKAAVASMNQNGVSLGYTAQATGGVLPRGKVLFGMARDQIRRGAQSLGSTWSIQNGKINIIPLDGFIPGEALKLSAATGLVGIPEQTQNGIVLKCLLNPRLLVGSLIQIDNKSINQLVQQDKNAAPVPYNQWTGLQLLAKTTSDGVYRLYVAEFEGDTRGTAWYSHLTCLAVDASSGKVKPYG